MRHRVRDYQVFFFLTPFPPPPLAPSSVRPLLPATPVLSFLTSSNLNPVTTLPIPTTITMHRSNPFFATTSTFFAPSVGDKVDQAISQSKQYAHDAQAKANELAGKADMKVQDAKEAVKVGVKQGVNPSPTGADLYARWVF